MDVAWHCHDCGWVGDEDDLFSYSLDDDEDILEIETFSCPVCGSTNLDTNTKG